LTPGSEASDELRQRGSDLDADQLRFMRNRAFALVRERVTDPANTLAALQCWRR
jgi:cardiolipin hydrolase